MKDGPIRRYAFASRFGAMMFFLVVGSLGYLAPSAYGYIAPSAYTVALKEKTVTSVSPGCPPIGSEWLAKFNARGKKRRNLHPGIDIHGSLGTPILSGAAGKVLIVDETHGGGRFVAVHHGTDNSGNHVYTTYWHLDTILVSAGEEVERGQQIATMGSTGFDSGGWDNYHLHLAPLVGPSPPEFENGKITRIQFNNYRGLGVNPRFLWYPYSSNKSPPSAGVAHRYDPSRDYGDKPGNFAGLTYPVSCQ